MHSFTTEVRGHVYHGLWRRSGDLIEVRSDYGQVKALLNDRSPEVAARSLLAGMIPRSWKS